MSSERALFLDPEATHSQTEEVEVSPRGLTGARRALKLSAGILGGGLLVTGAVAAVAKASGHDVGAVASELIDLAASLGIKKVCGVGEDIEETTCAEDGSLVREQGRAVAKMVYGCRSSSCSVCTAWMVRRETSSKGALMLTTGHCAGVEEANFVFDYVKPCGGGQSPSQDRACKGTRIHAEVDEDEEAVYELERPCSVVHTRIPIKLDVGSPDVGEGVYIIGHPNGRPQYLSHEELHDGGRNCRLTAVHSNGRVYYHCDTQGGNSGSPVFSARTGYAFAIHKTGSDCNAGHGNGGTLLTKTSVKAALRALDIDFEDRSVTDLMYQGSFAESSPCHASDSTVDDVDLNECKALCLNGLSCVAIAHSERQKRCYITAVRGTSRKTCPSDAKHYTLNTRSLYRAPPRDSSAGALCLHTCAHSDDGECDDGGHNSLFDGCALGTDCKDCGVRHDPPDAGICKNTCKYANDKVCDDGGKDAPYDFCELGTDCDDCGSREA